MSLGEECAVFGVYGVESAAFLSYLGLYALQHRGQESTGIISLDQGQFKLSKSLGLVSDAYDVD
eukprot:SAG25_NODE_14170_length_258_cov_0.647799_1_plen_63_part_01